MFPQVQVNPFSNRRRPRPINPFDNPSTTGLLTNPNGSYVANPVPTTAYAGGQGGFGATLPQVTVGNIPNFLSPGATNPFASALQNRSFTNPIQPFTQNAMSQYRQGEQNYSNAPARPQPQSLSFQVRPQGSSLSSAMNQYRQDEKGNVFDVNNPIFGAVVQRLANGEAADLTKQDQEALEKFLLKEAGITAPDATGGGGGGSDDFMNTEFMQKNLEQGVGFYDQLTWDPQRKKYMKIGILMREGKLTPQGNWNKKGKKKNQGAHRRAQIATAQAQYATQQQTAPTQAAAPQVREVTQGFAGSYGLINFNTATG